MTALMNPEDIRDSLFQFWVDNYSTTPTQYPNTDFPDILKQSPFVTFEIDFHQSKTVTKSGGGGNRHRGRVSVSVNVPRGSGNKTSYAIANEVVQLLSNTRIAQSISFNSAWIDKEENREEHFTLIVLAPFTATIA